LYSSVVQNPDGQWVRAISANDTLISQPQDDPALQRAVAKHVVTALGTTDGSSWVVREVSRGPQGWTFTYICKDSVQSWNRQHGNATKPVVGEYSMQDPDPIVNSEYPIPDLAMRLILTSTC
jgi:ATP-dependent DNA helicase 2 subunit 1